MQTLNGLTTKPIAVLHAHSLYSFFGGADILMRSNCSKAHPHHIHLSVMRHIPLKLVGLSGIIWTEYSSNKVNIICVIFCI